LKTGRREIRCTSTWKLVDESKERKGKKRDKAREQAGLRRLREGDKSMLWMGPFVEMRRQLFFQEVIVFL
jgi:hypothetical protein